VFVLYLVNFADFAAMLFNQRIDSCGDFRQIEIVVVEADAAARYEMTPDEIEIISHIIGLVVAVDEAEDKSLPFVEANFPGVHVDGYDVVKGVCGLLIYLQLRASLQERLIDFTHFNPAFILRFIAAGLEDVNGVHPFAVFPGEPCQFDSAAAHEYTDFNDVTFELVQFSFLYEVY
jgi:hypothetical protein